MDRDSEVSGATSGDGSRYIWPPTLREFLDSGGDLTSFGLLDSLVEAIVVARRLLPEETNRRQAFRNRRFVDRWFDRHGGEPAVPATQELLTFALWKAECLEDPVLAERFEAALPPETLARGLRLVEDLRHVHPLAIEEDLTNWTCRACGETWEMAPAVVVTNTGDELGYDDDLAYCLGCLSIATAALESASGIDRFARSLEDEGLGVSAATPASEPEPVSDEVDVDLDLAGLERELLDPDELRKEAERLTAALEASQRRMEALAARRAALIRRLETDGS
jgi:hypothetical protein